MAVRGIDPSPTSSVNPTDQTSKRGVSAAVPLGPAQGINVPGPAEPGGTLPR